MTDLATLMAKRLIQRRDVKAVQLSNGEWMPHTVTNKYDGERIPWKMRHIEEHLASTATYGHYLLDTDSKCRVFAFDIDLETTGWIPTTFEVETGEATVFAEGNPRDEWRKRKSPARPWMKYQFRMLAEKLAATAHKELELEVAVAYSGSKGVHAYCFHEPMPAADSRAGAQLVLDTLDEFVLTKGSSFYKHRDTDCYTGYPNLSVEVFPKQTSLDGKDLGNLMRLPLGRNLKTTDPTFFIDCTAPMSELRPTDALTALTSGNPWTTA